MLEGLSDLLSGDLHAMLATGAEHWRRELLLYGQLQSQRGVRKTANDASIPILHISPDPDETEPVAYPCDPSTTIIPKSYLPSWFKRLKVLIRLKECPDTQRIERSEANEE